MGRRGRRCSVCGRDPIVLAKIGALRETGESYRAISALTGINRFSIARHFRHSGQPADADPLAPVDELAQSDERLYALANQLSVQYAAAISCGDNKVALEITKVLARLETERHHRIVKKVQTAAASNANNPQAGAPSVEFCDGVLASHRAFIEKEKSWGMIPCPCCEDPSALVYPRQIRERMDAIQRAANQPDIIVVAPRLPNGRTQTQ